MLQTSAVFRIKGGEVGEEEIVGGGDGESNSIVVGMIAEEGIDPFWGFFDEGFLGGVVGDRIEVFVTVDDCRDGSSVCLGSTVFL